MNIVNLIEADSVQRTPAGTLSASGWEMETSPHEEIDDERFIQAQRPTRGRF